MNIRRILCPIDFSDFSSLVNEYASALAESTGAEIVYLHASHPDVPFSTYAQVDMDREESRLLDKLRQFGPTSQKVKATYAVEFGSPSNEIVEFARENDIDLIVMGTHGRSGLKRALMGSVAEAVVRRAACPVLALKTKADAMQPG